MSKRIVFCADGTWETAAQHTNVYRLFKSLVVDADQMPFYDDGVGASGDIILKVLGGAFGTGLWQKIKEGYTKIAQVYEAGDEIFLFGFSRGAYTARSLAGMIAVCGLPTENFTDALVDTAFRAYREKGNRQALLAQLAGSHMFGAKIKMVGVWDTVGSLGIPSALGGIDPILYGFLDTGLHPDVLNAYHAMAIDEKRVEFPATLWTSPPAPGQTVEQVWFCGVHEDVGGGEPSDASNPTALSDITLGWIMNKAIALGLKVDANIQAQYPSPGDPKYSLDTLHESWNILCGFPRRRTISRDAAISNSVFIRCQHDNSYRPANLQFDGGSLSASYKAVTVVSQPPGANPPELLAGAAGR